MRKRIGNCEYCSIPVMDDDHYCVGCGAPANITTDEFYIDPSAPVEVWEEGRNPPSLFADWNQV